MARTAIGVRFVDDRFDELAMNDSLISDTGDQNSVLVPRFVMYGGWSTSLILANRKNDSATGIVKILSQAIKQTARRIGTPTQKGSK